jgi:CubicO group peptidase (beta-lactamase class C family)
MKPAWIVVLALTCHLTAAARPDPAPSFLFVDGSERLSRRIDCAAWRDRPGFAIAVLHRDELLLREDCGLAKLDGRVPIGPSTRFHLGQTSTLFTAAAVLRLHDQGQIDLDDTLAEYFPELPAWAQQVRVMHLLQHTSGLPDPLDAARPTQPLDGNRMMRFLRREPELSFAPGSDFAANDADYAILAELVERVSGQSFADYLEREVFRPARLEHTAIYEGARVEIPDRALGYREASDRFVPADDDPAVALAGARGIFTTLDDLRRFQRALLGDVLLEPDSVAIMLHTPLTLKGKQSPLGMAWHDATVTSAQPRHAGLRGYAASGSAAGFWSTMTYYPDEELTIILLANTDEPPPFAADSFREFLISVPTR